MALQQNIMQCKLYFDKISEIMYVKAKKESMGRGPKSVLLLSVLPF